MPEILRSDLGEHRNKFSEVLSSDRFYGFINVVSGNPDARDGLIEDYMNYCNESGIGYKVLDLGLNVNVHSNKAFFDELTTMVKGSSDSQGDSQAEVFFILNTDDEMPKKYFPTEFVEDMLLYRGLGSERIEKSKTIVVFTSKTPLRFGATFRASETYSQQDLRTEYNFECKGANGDLDEPVSVTVWAEPGVGVEIISCINFVEGGRCFANHGINPNKAARDLSKGDKRPDLPECVYQDHGKLEESLSSDNN